MHAKSLRAIGQLLEAARITRFELHNDGEDYLFRSDSVTHAGEWILRHAINDRDLTAQSSVTDPRPLRFTPPVISRLDSMGQKQRRNHASAQMQSSKTLSQLLRTVGDHIDRSAVTAFHVFWNAESVCVDYQEPDGQRDSRTFTAEKLQQLGLHIRFRRSSR